MSHEKIPDEVVWPLERADGYLDLHMVERAERELEQIDRSWRGLVPYRQITLRIALERHEWLTAATIARHLRDENPDEPAYWLNLAYAIRRCQSIADARAELERARKLFPKVAVIPFNLACYACQMQDMDKALAWLAAAIKLDPGCRAMAMDDTDLHALWPTIENELF